MQFHAPGVNVVILFEVNGLLWDKMIEKGQKEKRMRFEVTEQFRLYVSHYHIHLSIPYMEIECAIICIAKA